METFPAPEFQLKAKPGREQTTPPPQKKNYARYPAY